MVVLATLWLYYKLFRYPKQGVESLRRLMILTIAKNPGGTNEYRKVLMLGGMTQLNLVIPAGEKVIPEEEIWRVFKWVHDNDHESYQHLALSAIDTAHRGIQGWEEKYPIDRILAALQACRARIHLEFQ